MSERVVIYIDPGVWKNFREVCKKNKLTASAVASIMFEWYVEKGGKSGTDKSTPDGQ